MNGNTSAVKEEKKLKRFKPNIIDFLIVIVLIAAIASIVFRFGLVDTVFDNGAGEEEVRIEFRIMNINKDSYDYLIVGDEFRSVSHKYCAVGKLERVDAAQPAETYVSKLNGELVKESAPLVNIDDPTSFDRIDVTGAFLSKGEFKDGCYLLGGKNYIAPGSQLTVESKNISVLITVMDIVKTDGSAQNAANDAK